MLWMFRLVPLLAAFWLVLSGHFTTLLMSLGVVSVLLVSWIVYRMGAIYPEGSPARLSRYLPVYCVWLTGQVVLSALSVTRQVWSPGGTLRPAVDLTPANDLPELSQVIYANSITLTPGTLSLSVDDESIEVHSLNEPDLAELRAGGMLERVRQLEAR